MSKRKIAPSPTDKNCLWFWCPACEVSHRIPYGSGPGARWEWNGNVYTPSFTPSIKVTHRYWVPRPTVQDPYPENQVQVDDLCHSFIKDGNIRYLQDCTHKMAGETMPLPPFEHWKD